MKAKIRAITISIETDKGKIERRFGSISEVVEFFGDLHPKAGVIAKEISKYGRIAVALSHAAQALDEK